MRNTKFLIPAFIFLTALFLNASADQNLDKAKLHFDKGYALYQAKNFIETVTEFKQAVKLDPANKVYHTALGDAYFNMRDYQKVIDSYEEAVSIDQEWNWPTFRIGLCFFEMNDQDRALIYFQRAQELGYESAESYISRLSSNPQTSMNNITASQLPMTTEEETETEEDEEEGSACSTLTYVLAAGELVYFGIKVLGDVMPELTGFWSIYINQQTITGTYRNLFWGEVKQSDSSLSGMLDNRGYGGAKYQLTGTVDGNDVSLMMSAQYIIYQDDFYYNCNTTIQCSMTRQSDFRLFGRCNDTTSSVRSDTGETLTSHNDNLETMLNIALQDN